MKKQLLSSSRLTKQILALLADFISICLATIFALLISSVQLNSLTDPEIVRLLWLPCLSVFIFYISGVYRSVLRFIDFSTISLLLRSIVIAFALIYLLKLLLIFLPINLGSYFIPKSPLIVFEGWVIGSLTSILLITGSRILANYYFTNSNPGKRVVIYGAGDAGIQLASALRVSKEMRPIAFIDANPSLHGTFLGPSPISRPRLGNL